MNFKEGDKQQILEYSAIKEKLYAFSISSFTKRR